MLDPSGRHAEQVLTPQPDGLNDAKNGVCARGIMPCVLLSGQAFAATCRTSGSYERWLEDFKKDAAAQGVSPRVIAAAAPSMTFDQAIIRRDHGQAVFNQTFLQFSDRMVVVAESQRACQDQAARRAVPRGGEISHTRPGPDRFLGTGKRLRCQFRQLQYPERTGDPCL